MHHQQLVLRIPQQTPIGKRRYEKQYAAAETQPPAPVSNDSIPAELCTFSINSRVAGSSSTIIARFSMVGFGHR